MMNDPQLVGNKRRLEFGDEIEGGERPVVNVPSTGAELSLKRNR